MAVVVVEGISVGCDHVHGCGSNHMSGKKRFGNGAGSVYGVICSNSTCHICRGVVRNLICFEKKQTDRERSWLAGIHDDVCDLYCSGIWTLWCAVAYGFNRDHSRICESEYYTGDDASDILQSDH